MKTKKKWMKCILALVLSVALCVTGILPNAMVTALAESTTEENPFFDVDQGSWQYNFVKYVYDMELMKGKDETDDGKIIFEPNASITRAEFVRILYNKEKTPAVTYENVFADVPEGVWYTKAAIWAYQNNIAVGDGTNFNVSVPISREEMATMLFKYAKYKNYDVSKTVELSGYSDVSSISSWAVKNLKWAVAYNIITGTSDGRIAPTANATRAEAATMIKKLIVAYESSDDGGDEVVAITGLSLNQTTATLTVGDSTTLTATCVPSNTTQTGVTWKSSNESVATVNNGVVTAVGEGTAVITVTSTSNSGISAKCTVTVEAEEVPDDPVTPSEPYGVTQNTDGSVTFWVQAENSTPPATVYYILNNTNPALANMIGMNMTADSSMGENYFSATITGLNYSDGDTLTYLIGYVPVGETGRTDSPYTTITLGSASGGDEDTEVAITALGLNKTTATLTVGGSTVLSAVYTPSNTTQKGVTWTTSNASVAAVSNGTVTAIGEGTAVITVTSTSNAAISASCTVTVEAVSGGEEPDTPSEVYGATQNTDGSITFWVQAEDSTPPATVYYILNNTNPALSAMSGVNMVADSSMGENYFSTTVSGLNYEDGDTLTYLIGYVPVGATGRTDSPYTTITLGSASGGDEDTEVAITALGLSKTTATLTVGGSTALSAVYTPSNTTQKGVIWTTSNASVATVNNGTVTAIGEGTAVITVTSTSNTTISASCTVTVEAASGGEEPDTPSEVYGATQNADGSVTFWVQAEDSNPPATVYYILNNTNPALADMIGMNMTADSSRGENYFSVTASGLNYSDGDTLTYLIGYVPVGGSGRTDSPYTTITLGTASGGDEDVDVAITALGLNKTTASVEVGSAVKLSAVYTPSNTTETGVTWKSSNESVAKVVDGRVTGVTEGTAVITVTSTVNTALSATCTVTVVAETEDNEPEPKEDQMYFYFKNETEGVYSDDEVYWCILGKDPSTHELCYVNTEGELIPATPALNTIPVGDRVCADIFFTLEEKDFVYMPNIESGRMYFSYGSPVYVTINEAIDGTIGFAGPDLNNTTDPNQNVLFEFIEFTIIDGVYWGNTTRVDFFSFPIVSTLKGEGGFVNAPGDADVFEKTVGDIGTREEIFAAFAEEVPEEFKSLITDLRILAPCKGAFNEGKQYENYLDDYITEIFEEYKDKDLVFTCQPGTFRGRTTADGTQMIFSQDGGETGLVVNKPTTQEAFEGKGALATGSTMELVVQAQFCAAINRGVAHLTDSQWDDESLFYQNEVGNFYAEFFHNHSIDGLAYGFCYDDVYDYSSLLHYTKPTGLTIELKW